MHRAPSVLLAAAVIALPALLLAQPAPTPAPPAPKPTAAPAQPTAAVAAPAQPALAIPFEKYTLKNGLVVILSEDRTVPMVTVSTMVKVGSRFEPPKRSGFAHLFEHLMFMGTERVPTGKFDAWMEAEGGWNNAWTSEDRTHYFDVAPAHVLPLLLWLEADRISSLGKTMTQEKLDAQRDVVKNERRQRIENQPYGMAELALPDMLYPVGHPYHHPVIGSHEDLEAASVDDVKKFFADWYIPSNMALTVVGDFDRAKIKPEIERLFGGLPAGKAPAAPPAKEAKLPGVVRRTLEDEVALPKIIMAFHSPAHFAPGDADLDILSSVLQKGKTSRLYKALVYDKELAQSVSASQVSQELSSYFEIEAIARPNVSLEQLEKAIDAVLKDVLDKGVTQAEVDRAKNDYETAFVRQLESVHNRASLLASYETFRGDPGFIAKDLDRYRKVDVASVGAVAKANINLDSRVILKVVPRPKKPEAKKPDGKKGDGAAKGGKK
jgi:predicted Zn-dependent peptidase